MSDEGKNLAETTETQDVPEDDGVDWNAKNLSKAEREEFYRSSLRDDVTRVYERCKEQGISCFMVFDMGQEEHKHPETGEDGVNEHTVSSAYVSGSCNSIVAKLIIHYKVGSTQFAIRNLFGGGDF